MMELGVEVVEVPQASCFERVDLEGVVRAAAPAPVGSFSWSESPGAVRVAADGQLEALHFAPGRWLLPEPSAELLAAIGDSAILVDVEGKWRRRSLRGKGAMRLIAAAADVEAMLTGRNCAALTLFDCPAIVARGNATLELWIHSSYARFLDEQLAHALARFPSRGTP